MNFISGGQLECHVVRLLIEIRSEFNLKTRQPRRTMVDMRKSCWSVSQAALISGVVLIQGQSFTPQYRYLLTFALAGSRAKPGFLSLHPRFDRNFVCNHDTGCR
jgi:hypothetical protein